MDLVISKCRNLIEEFLGSLANPATKKAYRIDLEHFFSYFNGSFHAPADITLVHLIQFRDALSQTDLSTSTINRKIACLKSFLHWCVLQGFMHVSPALSLKVRKANVKNPTIAFTDEEALKLLKGPKVSTFHGNNHKLMLEMLFLLGLRRSELVNLKLGDLKEERGTPYVRIIGKGDKCRDIALSEALWASVQMYLKAYTQLTGLTLEEDDFLFQSMPIGKAQKPINANSIFRIVTTYAKRVGLGKRVSPHSCRATVISQLLENGVSPRDVADFAGHENINTTINNYDKKRIGLTNSAALKVNYGT